MTLEDAMEKIKEQAEKDWEEFEKTGSEMYKGFSLGADDALDILSKVDAEPVVKDKLTLTELADELMKLLGFRYLVAYGSELYGYRVRAYLLKPKYILAGGYWFNDTRGNDALLDISFSDLRVNLDLSEYKDSDGNIDYSKCIVEVE